MGFIVRFCQEGEVIGDGEDRDLRSPGGAAELDWPDLTSSRFSVGLYFNKIQGWRNTT